MLSTLKKVNFLITKRQRKGLVVLTLLLFIGMILEVFGLGILIPTISIISDPKMIESNSIMSSIRSFFHEFSDNEFIFIFLGIVVIIYFIKSFFLVFLVFKQNRFINNISANISYELLKNYMNQPYNFHLKQNTSELLKNVQVEVHHFHAYLLSLITLIIEGGFVLSILATLIYVEPIGAISIGVFFGILSLIFLRLTQKKIAEWGNLRQEVDTKAFKIALEALGGIKELIIFGKKSFFINDFKNNIFFKSRLSSNHATVTQIPRFYLELISIIGLISFIILFLLKGQDFATIVSILGLFVAATFRMMPSLNRMIAAKQSLKFNGFSLNIIHRELKLKAKYDDKFSHESKFNFQNIIEFKKVNFKFNKSNTILKSVDLKIIKGESIGIIGESGSGKSTLIDLLVGLHEPTSGEILVDGINGFQMTQSWRNTIGYVSQSIHLMDDTIKNNIAFGIPEEMIDIFRINSIVKQVKLEKFVSTLKYGFNTKVGERGVQLSGGQRQRIGIARALYHDPDIIILDEATSALDLQTESDVMNAFKSLKETKTIIMVAHRLSTLESCNVIYKIENGEIQKLNTTYFNKKTDQN